MVEKGLESMIQGLADLQEKSIGFMQSFLLTLPVGAYVKLGRTEEALATLTTAMHSVNTTGERFWEAEVHRLQGELLLAPPNDLQSDAEGCFHRALDVARRQGARSLELRAVTSLSQLWQKQEKSFEARRILQETYDSFAEGFDTEDLQQARTLLQELEGMC